jgi:hypothetical protein
LVGFVAVDSLVDCVCCCCFGFVVVVVVVVVHVIVVVVVVDFCDIVLVPTRTPPRV